MHGKLRLKTALPIKVPNLICQNPLSHQFIFCIMGLWAACPSGRCPCQWQWGWNNMIFKVASNPGLFLSSLSYETKMQSSDDTALELLFDLRLFILVVKDQSCCSVLKGLSHTASMIFFLKLCSLLSIFRGCIVFCGPEYFFKMPSQGVFLFL